MYISLPDISVQDYRHAIKRVGWLLDVVAALEKIISSSIYSTMATAKLTSQSLFAVLNLAGCRISPLLTAPAYSFGGGDSA